MPCIVYGEQGYMLCMSRVSQRHSETKGDSALRVTLPSHPFPRRAASHQTPPVYLPTTWSREGRVGRKSKYLPGFLSSAFVSLSNVSLENRGEFACS